MTFYKLVVDANSRASIGKVFGFCDGKHIYINELNHKLQSSTEFNKLEYVGAYCYYEDLLCTSLFNGRSTINSCYRNSKMIDVNTGEVIYLSKSTFRDLISDNTELLTEYNNERKKKTKYKAYLIRYLEQTESDSDAR